KMPLYGNDIDETTSPLEASLGWVVKLDKPDFVGKQVLQQQKSEGFKRQWVGLKMLNNMIPRRDYPVLAGGQPIGKITSGLLSPCLKVGIGCAYVPPDKAAIGTKLEVVVRGTPHPAEVVKTPFV